MIYPSDFEIKVGFNRIRKMVESYCVTRLAAEKLSGIKFMTDVRQVRTMLRQTNEMKTIVMLESDFPNDGFVDTLYFINKVAIDGAYLLPEELGALRNSLSAVNGLVRFFDRKRGNYPTLAKATDKVDSFPNIVSDINRIIDSKNEVRDNASPELARIRGEIAYSEREASKRLHSILRKAISDGIVDEDTQIAIRDGKGVIPVTAANKKKIRGYIQDESATGRTSFIEPQEVMELNNQLRELRYSEKHEVVRILIAFTEEIRPYSDALTKSAHFIAAIDLIRAKSRVAIDMRAGMPIVDSDKIINIREGRHPLLEKNLRKEGKDIVPLNMRLTPEKRILVISGPNAGGKSVCLKTMGLLQYMIQMGLLVPMNENSEMTVFSKLFIDIGDQQSIDNDLSTYSSHLANMKQILRSGDVDSLVLIDEFGTGTEPALGGAIAEVVLQRIENKGAYGIITTHYSNIKYYAANSEGVINGAMEFDVHKIEPLFRLEMGKPGSSFAFEIARKIGLPEDLVRAAEGKIGDSRINIERQLRQIARDKSYWENKRDNIRQSERRYEKAEKEYEELLSQLKEQKQEILRKAREEAKALISKTNSEIERTIKEIKEAEAERNKTKDIREQFNTFVEEIENTESDPDIERKIEQIRARKARKEQRRSEKKKESINIKPIELQIPKVGDSVKMAGQTVVGKVIEINKKRAQVAFGTINTTVDISKLEIVAEGEVKKHTTFANDINKHVYSVQDKRLSFKSDIDLRGARVEEALEKVRDLIDNAIMLGIREVRILHGKGTGALKEEIRKYLRTQPNVTKIVDAHVEMGGAGITEVSLEI